MGLSSNNISFCCNALLNTVLTPCNRCCWGKCMNNTSYVIDCAGPSVCINSSCCFFLFESCKARHVLIGLRLIILT